MRKRMISFLLSGILLLGAAAGPAYAAPATDERAVTEEAPVMEEAPVTAEEDGAGIRLPGGLERPVNHETDAKDMPEAFRPKEDANQKASAVYRYDWDKYSTNYYYNQLSASKREFWDKLDEMCISYLTGADSLAITRDSDGRMVCQTKSVMFTGMPRDTAVETAFLFKYSNPQYYFLDSSIYSSGAGYGGMVALTVFPEFAQGGARSQATAQMKSVIDNWMAQINAQPDDLSKEKLAHDLICAKMTYDFGYEDPSIPMNPYNQVAYSVFCTDTTVCAGYSQALQLLLNGANVDCAVVTSLEHEWNIVRLNGTWYCVDVTWNDNIADDKGLVSTYPYFNRSEQVFIHDAELGSRQHLPESIWNGMLPALVYDSGASESEIGTIFTPSAGLAAPQIVCTGNTVTIAAPAGGTIYYTLNGTTPSIASTRSQVYLAPFSISGVTTVTASAAANGYYDSPVSSVTITPQYTVTFHANGGYIGSKSTKSIVKSGILYGAGLGSMTDPKRSKYAFLGWYTSTVGGRKVSASDTVTADLNLYAHWAKIKPGKTAVASVKNSAKKTMRIKVKKNAAASGYQIRYSLRKNMSSAKKKDVTETSLTINKLAKGKTYYVQARTFQKDSVTGKKKYGSWSKVKSVKIKK